MDILFVVGKFSDFFPIKYTSKKCPLWLKNNWEGVEDFIDTDEKKVPSDVAMAVYLEAKHRNVTTYLINGDEVKSKKDFDNYDVVFVINDPSEVEKPKVLLNAMSKTSAFVFPYPDYQKVISNKYEYYSYLKKAGIQVAPFFKATVSGIKSNPEALKKKALSKKWKGIIIKPSFGGYATGIKVYKNIAKTTASKLKKDMDKLAKSKRFSNLTVAEFVTSFGSHFEIRTYWIDGKYAYSIATLTSRVGKTNSGLGIDEETTFRSEGGKLSNDIKKELISLGKDVIKALPQYKYGQPFMRIDFGCCIETDEECPETYFVNEVETMSANMLPEDTKYPVVTKTAEALYKFAKKVDGKKNNPKSRKPTFKVKRSSCVLP